MSNTLNLTPGSVPLTVYQIRIKGHLSSEWTEWFSGMSIARDENGEILLTGPVVDQSALYGLLNKVRDLGMPLLELRRLIPDELNKP